MDQNTIDQVIQDNVMILSEIGNAVNRFEPEIITGILKSKRVITSSVHIEYDSKTGQLTRIIENPGLEQSTLPTIRLRIGIGYSIEEEAKKETEIKREVAIRFNGIYGIRHTEAAYLPIALSTRYYNTVTGHNLPDDEIICANRIMLTERRALGGMYQNPPRLLATERGTNVQLAQGLLLYNPETGEIFMFRRPQDSVLPLLETAAYNIELPAKTTNPFVIHHVLLGDKDTITNRARNVIQQTFEPYTRQPV
ncbi:MAG: hypothetical protein WC254_04620 [Candidatus Woesearchaeota archaeon]|jgi:hypothetical protein